jgi:hypothetical protein
VKKVLASILLCVAMIANLSVQGIAAPGHLNLNVSQVGVQKLEPVLRVKDEAPSNDNNFDPPNAAQFAIAASNVIYYRRKQSLVALDALRRQTLWTMPLPWLFTAYEDLLITSSKRGLITAYSAKSRTRLWSFLDKAEPVIGAMPSEQPEIGVLTVIGDVLMIGRRSVKNGSMTTAWGLEPSSGRVLWKSAPSIEKRSFRVALERYMVLPIPFRSPPSSYLEFPNVIDAQTGKLYETDAVLNQSQSGQEFVTLDYPTEPALIDHPVRDSFVVTIKVRSTNAEQHLLQVLGTFDLMQPIECLNTDHAFDEKNKTWTAGRAVRFLGADQENVWLAPYNNCNFRVVQISRDGSRRVTIIDIPEKLNPAQRISLYRSGKIPDPYIRGRLSLEQRVAFLGEDRIVAKIRSASDAEALLWYKRSGTRLYALYLSKELRAYDARSGALLQRLHLAISDKDEPWKYFQFGDHPVDLNGRVFTWRNDAGLIGTYSSFFLLPQ